MSRLTQAEQEVILACVTVPNNDQKAFLEAKYVGTATRTLTGAPQPGEVP